MLRPVICLSMLMLVAHSGCLQDDLRVPGDCTTIQACIDRAADGGVVRVEAGTYYENLRFNGRAVHVMSVSGAEQTIIDGSQLERVVVFQAGEGPDTVLEGFTLTHGGDATLGRDGGAVYIRDSSPTLTDLIISDSAAGDEGGGVYLVGDAAPLLTRVRISGNSAGFNGGGICAKDGASPILQQVIVEANFAGENGGGIYSKDGAMELYNVVIDANSSGEGGGLACNGCLNHLVNVSLVGNSTTIDGAGLRLTNGARPVLANVIIAGNNAGDDGGGMRINTLSDPRLTNVSIVGNMAGGSGGGIDLRDASLTMVNTILAGNRADLDDVGSGGGGLSVAADTVALEVSYAITWDNEPDGYFDEADPTSQHGNVDVDPQWIDITDEDPALWDLHLAEGSEAIDAGDPGIADPDGSVSDPGAYGGPGAANWDLAWDD